MDYWHANDWFCNSIEGKAIIKTDRDYSRWGNRNRECQKWIKTHDRNKPGEGDQRLGKTNPFLRNVFIQRKVKLTVAQDLGPIAPKSKIGIGKLTTLVPNGKIIGS